MESNPKLDDISMDGAQSHKHSENIIINNKSSSRLGETIESKQATGRGEPPTTLSAKNESMPSLRAKNVTEQSGV